LISSPSRNEEFEIIIILILKLVILPIPEMAQETENLSFIVKQSYLSFFSIELEE